MNLLKDINALKVYIDSLEKNEIQTFFENNFDEILLEKSVHFLDLFLEKNVIFKEIVNGLPILSYCINLGVNDKNLEKLINYGVSTNFYHLITPYEIAIQSTAHIFIFNLLCKKGLIQTSKGSLPIIHQLVEAKNLGQMLKLKLIEDLISQHNLDLNEEVKNEDTIVLKLLNSSQMKLLPKLIIKGADIKEILEGFHYRVHNDILKEIKPYLFKTQPKKTARKCVCLLNYEDFKQYFKETKFDENRRLIHEMLDNTILTDNERIELTKIALEKGSNINERDENDLTPLEKFIRKYYLYGKTTFVEFLIENDALIDDTISYCLTYLVQELDLKALEFFLEKGLNPNFIDKDGFPLISYLYINRTKDKTNELRLEVVKLLLSYGFDINQKVLIDEGFKVEPIPCFHTIIRASDSYLALYFLTEYKDLDLDEEFLTYSILHDLDNEVIFNLYEKFPNFKVKEYIYDKQNDCFVDVPLVVYLIFSQKFNLALEVLNKFPYSNVDFPVFSIIEEVYSQSGNFELIYKLIDNESNINRVFYTEDENSIGIPNTETYSILSSMIYLYHETKDENIINIAKAIIKKGFNLSSNTEDLIYYAITYDKDTKLVDFLLENNVNINNDIFEISFDPNLADDTTLAYLKLLEKKLKDKIFLEEKDILEALKGLIVLNKLESIEYLYSLGLNINSKDKSGRTACHLAMLFKNSQALNIFLHFLPNLELEDENGSKAIHYLADFNYDKDDEIEFLKTTLPLLVLYGANINDDFNPLINFLFTLNLKEQEDFINFEKLIKQEIAQIFIDNGADIDFSIKILEKDGLCDELTYLKKLKLTSYLSRSI